MTTNFFNNLEPIAFADSASDDTLAFRHYQPEKLVLGKSMREHLRFAVCYWHNFVWPGYRPLWLGDLSATMVRRRFERG